MVSLVSVWSTSKSSHWLSQITSSASRVWRPAGLCSGPFVICALYQTSWDSLLVTAPDSWSKGCEFKSRQERQENFVLQSQLCVLTLIRYPFHHRVTAVARKRPWSFCQKCRWQVTPKHAYTLTHWSWNGLTMPVSRHSVGTYQEMSSHATRQEMLGHGHLSSLSHCWLILA